MGDNVLFVRAPALFFFETGAALGKRSFFGGMDVPIASLFFSCESALGQTRGMFNSGLQSCEQ